ncbi:MAG TPA: D-2-hydroxyacid dehydrogenase [Gemmatimonadaceae bacterium]|nr:D-2-hydroxyacid dehydrogenase [Gemmatimonadaceae bacterium]
MSRRLVVDLQARAPVWRLPPWGEDAIRASAPPGWETHVVRAPTVSDGDGGAPPAEEALAAIAGAEAYFGFGMSTALLERADALRWVHSAAAGVGSLLVPAVRERELLITNSAGIHAVPIAEYVVAGVLYLLRGLDLAAAAQRAHMWGRQAFVGADSPVREMGECAALIVGAGGIGSAVAERLAALGARCTGVRRRPALGVPPGFARVVGPDAWRDLLGDYNILVIAAPATNATRALVTGAELDRLPVGAIVVNVSRGSLLDAAALVERLHDRRLRGAVLDVFEREPLPPSSPLWDVPSVLVTPHVSGVSPNGFWRRELDLFTDNWTRYASGAPLRNVVDQRAGY